MSPNSFHESNAHPQVQTTAARSIFQARLHSSKSFKMSGRVGQSEVWRRMAARPWLWISKSGVNVNHVEPSALHKQILRCQKPKAPGRVGRAIHNAMDVAMPPLQIRWLSQPNLRQCRAMDRFGGDEFQHTSQYLPTAMVQEFRVVDQSQKMQKAHALSRCKSNQNRNPSGSSPNSPHTTRLSRFQILQELASLC